MSAPPISIFAVLATLAMGMPSAMAGEASSPVPTRAAAPSTQAASPSTTPAASPPSTRAPSPLFSSDRVLEITIEAPLGDIFRHRGGDRVAYPGRLELTGEGGGTEVTGLQDVELRTRGQTRLDKRICPFPPLSLKFRRKDVAGTLFEGQRRLKVVTHCRDDDDGEQRLLLESLAYRIYNQITDYSFRIRLARVTWNDTSGSREPVTRYAFLIEDVSEVADRTEWIPLSVPAVPPDYVDADNLVRLEFFQYLIGNTDWSAFMSDEEATTCCHNTKPVGGPAGPVFVLPYDFDITGLVNPRYADRLFRGNLQSLGLNSVRDRRFRGGCRSEALWPEVVTEFNARRDAIEAVVRDQEGLTARTRNEALAYVAGFYDVINDARRLRREIRGHCRTF